MFNRSQRELAHSHGWSEEAMQLEHLIEFEDYQFTTGGVTRMVLPLVQKLIQKGIARSVDWVSLNPNGPANVELEDKIILHHVSIEQKTMAGYGRAKEVMWNTLHGTMATTGPANQMLWQDEFSDYTYYNRRSAQNIDELDGKEDFDLFYIHDFQQLPMGSMLHTLKPKIFRWHIPFDETTIPPEWVDLLSSYLESYDSIIVSGKRYLKTLRRFGYNGHSDYVYPYIDPAPYRTPSAKSSKLFCRRFLIEPSDRVALIVARLDPIKGHDRAIVATADVLQDFPEVKLLIVGDGGFSSSKAGIGLSKSEAWMNRLTRLACQLGIEDRVMFTGYLSQEQLNAAYDRCELTLLPSVREGFGLVVIESWLFRKPTIVTSRAGICELIENGENGLLCDPEDTQSLAENIGKILENPRYAEKLGAKGFDTSSHCLIDRGVESEAEVISRLN